MLLNPPELREFPFAENCWKSRGLHSHIRLGDGLTEAGMELFTSDMEALKGMLEFGVGRRIPFWMFGCL